MPIPPQVLYPLITGGISLATQIATKPKKRESATGYMDKYIANLQGDLAKKETYHTMMRSQLGAIGKATSSARREAKYLGELKGTGGGILSAEMQRIQQGQNQSISQASDQANEAQRRESVGMQSQLREAQMMREQIVQQTREANDLQDQQFTQGLIQTGLQTAGQVGMGALQAGQEATKLAQEQAQQEGIMDIYSNLKTKTPVDIQAGVDSGLYDAATGIEMLEAQQELRKPNTQIVELSTGDNKIQKAIVNKITGETIKNIGAEYSRWQEKAVTPTGGTTAGVEADIDAIENTTGNLSKEQAERLPNLIIEQKKLVKLLYEQKQSWEEKPEYLQVYLKAVERYDMLENRISKHKITPMVDETKDEYIYRQLERGIDDNTIVKLYEEGYTKDQSRQEVMNLINKVRKIRDKDIADKQQKLIEDRPVRIMPTQQQTQGTDSITITTQEEYNALPSGTEYILDGQRAVKP